MPTNQTPAAVSRQPKQLFQKILDAACMYYECVEKDLINNPEFIDQKKIVMYLLRENAMLKYKKIATIFGYSDHGWPSRIVSEIESQKDIYAHIRHDINNVLQILSTL